MKKAKVPVARMRRVSGVTLGKKNELKSGKTGQVGGHESCHNPVATAFLTVPLHRGVAHAHG